MSDNEQTAVWSRARLLERKALLEENLKALEENFRALYHKQQGAILLIDDMIAQLDNPPPDVEKKARAAHRRKVRAEKRAGKVELPEPVPHSVNGEGSG